MKGYYVMKQLPLFLIPALLIGAMPINVTAATKNSMTIKITYPDKTSKTYTSTSYSSTKPLDLTKIKASLKNAKITLTKVIQNGKSVALKNISFSFDYMTSAKHINSLRASSTSLSLPVNFLKSTAKKSSTARFAVRFNTYAIEEVDPNFIIPLKESTYATNKSLLSFSYMKNGRYGTNQKGITLSNTATKVNGTNISKTSYAWWTSEYTYINKKWRASHFILSLNYPQTNDHTSHTAYLFKINRNTRGYIQSSKLTNILSYQGTNSYGEIWKKTASASRDAASLKLTKNWTIGSTFKYTYILTKPTLSKLTATSKGLIVSWKKATDADGYMINYSTSKSFKNTQTIQVNNYKTTKKTIKKLATNKKYYVRIRSYGVVDEKTYYSSYSSILSVKTK